MLTIFYSALLVLVPAPAHTEPNFASAIPCTTPSALSADETPDGGVDLDQRLAQLVERMEKERVELHIPGFALAVVKDGEVVLAQGFGLADVENNRAVEADTLFAIGSSTKAFTALAIGMLQDEGRMSFDDPVVNHLPDFAPKIDGPDKNGDSTLTMRDLLSHRTGFTRMTALWGPGTASRDVILRTAGNAEAWAGFREKFLYNNVMFMAAGEASAAAADKTWEELIQARIFDPLGMSSSNLSTSVAQKDPRLSLGYTWNEDTEGYDLKRMLDLASIGPAGAINSNVIDMAKWLRLQLARGEFEGERLVSEEVIQDTWTPNISMSKTASYGLGWMIHEDPDGLIIEHGGNIDGFGAQVAFMPEESVGFVLLTNVSVTPLQAKSISIVFEALLGENEVKPEAEAEFDRLLGDYVANFGPFANDDFEVLVQNGNLAVDVPGQTIYELHLPEEDGKRYFRLTREIAISFDTDEDGNPVGLKLYQSGMTFELPLSGVELAPEVPIEQFDRFLGSYRDDILSLNVEVKVANNRLAVDIPEQMVFQLHLPDEEGKRYFRVTNDIAVRFNQDESGLVTSMTFFERGQVREAKRILDEDGDEGLQLPSLDSILKNHGATDRAKLLLEHGSYRSRGTIRLAQSGIEGKFVFEARQSPPAYRLKVDLGPFGKMEHGSDGTIVWRQSEIRGYNESSGEELKQRLRNHPSNLHGDMKTSFDHIDIERRDSEGDRDLIVLKAKWGELPPRTIVVDAETGQRIRMSHNYIEGTMQVVISTTYEDYRDVSGVPVSHVMIEENVHTGRSIQTLESIELGVELADDFHIFKGAKD